MKKNMRKFNFLIGTLIFIVGIFLINVKNAQALTFNESKEDMWGASSSTLDGGASLYWKCEHIGNSSSYITIDNSNNKCKVTVKDIYANVNVSIKITQSRPSSTSVTTKTKPLNLRANAVKATIKVGETVNVASDFEKLGLAANFQCHTVSNSNILEIIKECTVGYSTRAFRAVGKAPGTAYIELVSGSGIKFRAFITVQAGSNITTKTTTTTTNTLAAGTYFWNASSYGILGKCKKVEVSRCDSTNCYITKLNDISLSQAGAGTWVVPLTMKNNFSKTKPSSCPQDQVVPGALAGSCPAAGTYYFYKNYGIIGAGDKVNVTGCSGDKIIFDKLNDQNVKQALTSWSFLKSDSNYLSKTVLSSSNTTTKTTTTVKTSVTLQSVVVSDSSMNTKYSTISYPSNNSTHYVNVPKSANNVRIYLNTLPSNSTSYTATPVGLQNLTGNTTVFNFKFTTNGVTTNITIRVEKDVNDYRWLNKAHNSLKCGTKLYITSCKGDICNYTSVNGSAATGTVDRNSLGTASNPNCGSSGTTTKAPNTTTYNVNFNTNGGSYIAPQPVAKGQKATKPANPTKANSNFVGWYSDSALTNEYNFSTTINSSITIYAKWVAIPPSSNAISEECVKTVNGTCVGEDRFAQAGATFSGLTVSCGDVVRVTTCQSLTSTSNPICTVSAINGVPLKVTTQVYRQKIMTATPSCGTITRYAGQNAKYYTDSNDIGSSQSKNMQCGSAVTIFGNAMDACIYGNLIEGSDTARQYCKVTYNGQTVYADRNTLTLAQPYCSAEPNPNPNPTPNPGNTPVPSGQICTPEATITGATNKDPQRKPVCYTYENGQFTAKGPNENEIYSCAQGYKLIKTEDSEDLSCRTVLPGQECHKTFIYSCMNSKRPRVSGAGGLVTPSGKGPISFTGQTIEGIKLTGYVVTNGEDTPTNTAGWQEFENDNYRITTQKEAGTYFVWVRNELNQISYPILLKVSDGDKSTTLNQISITSPNSNESYSVTPIDNGGATAYMEGITAPSVELLSNAIKRDSTIASGFDLFTTAYELTVSSSTIAVYATLTSNDSKYVEGYEPRTVELDFGRNVILIKVENNKGKIRTYTFVVHRTDNRESVNTLTSLTVSKGNLNFDPYVSDYTISVPKNTKSININGALKSGKAAFVEGYEPRNIQLNNDITSAVLKTMSEAGAIRNYVLTFIKTGSADDTDLSKSNYLSSLTVPGTELVFDKKTTSYSLAIEYEVTNLPVYALPESDKAKVDISGNVGLKVGANLIEVMVTNGAKTKLYTIYVNRKQDGLGVSTDTSLSSLTVKDYNINFTPTTHDYALKIKREKTLLLSATPNSDRSEVYMYGNNDLTAFSTIRVKVIAENGDTGLYSLDIAKDAYNKNLEITIAIISGILILGGVIIIIVRKKHKAIKDYVRG